jgi:hypothetical protein
LFKLCLLLNLLNLLKDVHDIPFVTEYCNDGRCVLNRRGQKHRPHGKGIKVDESEKGPTHKPAPGEACNDGRCKLTRKGECHPAHTERSQVTPQVVGDIKRDKGIAGNSEAREQEKLGGKYTFPKKVGIVFLERRKRVIEVENEEEEELEENEPKSASKKRRREVSLDFNQDACALFLLRMNQHQNIFEFQVVDIPEEVMIPQKKSITNLLRRIIMKSPKKNDTLGWVDDFASEQRELSIDYWIGITSELILSHNTWHLERKKSTKSKKMVWIITSKGWEKHRSPPSLFEYLLATVFRCALQSLSLELQNSELRAFKFLRSKLHKVTRGCMFDFTHRRTSVSIFKLCFGCKEKLSKLENLIWKNGNNVNLVEDVTTILSKEWMGTPEKRDSALYDLKKIYKYDVDRNSGFRKTWLEKIRDSVEDNTAQWIIGGLIGVAFLILGNLFSKALHITQ